MRILLLIGLAAWLILALEIADAKKITQYQALCILNGLHTIEWCIENIKD